MIQLFYVDHDPSHPPRRGGVRRSLAALSIISMVLKSPFGGFRGSYFINLYFITCIINYRAITIFTNGIVS